MAAFILTHRDGTQINLNSYETLTAVASGKQRHTFMGEDVVTMNVKSATPVTFAIGDRITLFGKEYTLNQLPTATKQGRKIFSYDLTFEGLQYELIESIFLLPNETKLDSFTGTLAEFAQMICDNANRTAGATRWVLANGIPNTETQTLTYTDKNALQVLQDICQVWGVGFRIELNNSGQRVLTIKAVVGETHSHVFKYGEIDGASKLVREKADDTSVITKLFVYGSSDNLGRNYRHNRLCLPSKNKNASFVTDGAKVTLFGTKEGIKAFDDIKPQRVGSVTAIVSGNVCKFKDSTMFDLNETTSGGDTKYLIAGTTAKVVFQTGALAGYEIDIESYNHSTKEFTLLPFTDSNGETFPSSKSAAFQLSVGDTYLLSDITLPQSYIEAAESKLQSEAQKWFNQYSKPQVRYSVQIDEAWVKKHFADSTERIFTPGDLIGIEDTDLGINGTIRIESIERDVIKPFSYSLSLNDKVSYSVTQRLISNLHKTEEIIKIGDLDNAAKQRRNWKTTQDVLNSVFDTDGYFTDKIRPQSIETQMLATGARSQQLTLANLVFYPNDNANANRIRWTAGRLDHFTINEEAVTSWNISSGSKTDLVSANSYYIYAKCNRASNAATITIETTQRKYDSDSGYYYFLVGTLTSVQTEGSSSARTLALTYGSSTINGQFLKTGVISSNSGGLTIDLNSGYIQGDLRFGSGTTVQNAVNTATNTANAASTAASTAQTTANTANTKATNAQTTATNAANAASTAQSTANNAANAASSAQTTANTLQYTLENGGVNLVNNSKDFEGWTTFQGQKILIFPIEPNTDYTISWESIEEVVNAYDIHTVQLGFQGSWGSAGWVNISTSETNYSRTIRVSNEGTSIYLYQGGWNKSLNNRFIIHNLKIEKGTIATAWTPSPNDLSDFDYLKTYLPTNATTDLSSGLVLSSVMGVKGGDGGASAPVVAGMDGTADSGAAMIWAGASNFAGRENAKFRVTPSGDVTAQGANLENVNIAGGSLMITNTAENQTIKINQTAIGTLRTEANGSGGSVNVPAIRSNVVLRMYTGQNQTTIGLGAGGAAFIAPATTTITLPNTITITARGQGASRSHSEAFINTKLIIRVGSQTQTIELANSATSVATSGSYGFYSKTFTITNRNFTIEAGTAVTITAGLTYTCTWGVIPVDTYICEIPFIIEAFTIGSSTASFDNHYAPNGYFLQSAINRYFGVNTKNTSNSDEVLLARSGNFGMSLMNKGLMLCTFSGTTITRYRMNPLVGIVKINGRDGGSSCDKIYNPLGSNVTCSRVTNRYKVTHNLNNSNLAFQVMGFGSNIYGYVYNIDNANNVTIETSVTNAQFILYIYDYSTY